MGRAVSWRSVPRGELETGLGLGWGRSGRRRRWKHTFVRGDQVPEQITDVDRATGFRAIRPNTENSTVDRFNLLNGLIALNTEERIAGMDELAVVLVPGDKSTLFHGPTEPRNDDFDRHN